MTDNELRSIVLKQFYEQRRGDYYVPTPQKLDIDISADDILQICDQLAQHQLLSWKSLSTFGHIHDGIGKITAYGIDVIEGTQTTPYIMKIENMTTVNISDSKNVVVGNNNTQNITQSMHELIEYINNSNVTEQEKNAAKGSFKKLLEHPIFATVIGNVISQLIPKVS